MGKKIANTLLFLAVLAAAVGMTLYVGQGVVSVLVYFPGSYGCDLFYLPFRRDVPDE